MCFSGEQIKTRFNNIKEKVSSASRRTKANDVCGERPIASESSAARKPSDPQSHTEIPSYDPSSPSALLSTPEKTMVQSQIILKLLERTKKTC
uniref:Uncharacterized protein n=1 Tax=Steinernema glaseri TaxID=37863 RepID=A0A1I7ZYT0_9BILA